MLRSLSEQFKHPVKFTIIASFRLCCCGLTIVVVKPAATITQQIVSVAEEINRFLYHLIKVFVLFRLTDINTLLYLSAVQWRPVV